MKAPPRLKPKQFRQTVDALARMHLDDVAGIAHAAAQIAAQSCCTDCADPFCRRRRVLLEKFVLDLEDLCAAQKQASK